MPKFIKGPIEKSQHWVMRLLPGEDLKISLTEFMNKYQIESAIIVSGVGSLQNCHLRLANSQNTLQKKSAFEIVSITGTLSPTGLHLHISLADENGQVIGGHLLDGNLILTTAEIVLLQLPEIIFERQKDSQTQYLELNVKQK